MKRLRKRVAVKPLALMSWCSMDRHAGWSGEDVFLCPGGSSPEKLRCDCACHDDKEMQDDALRLAREFKDSMVKSAQANEQEKVKKDAKPKRIRRIKRR